MKNILIILSITYLLSSCYKEDDYLISDYPEEVQISIVPEDPLANGLKNTEVKVIFPNDFNAADQIQFVFPGTEIPSQDATLRLITEGGEAKKVASIQFGTLSPGPILVQALISTKQVQFEKPITVHFRKAYPSQIAVEVSQLRVVPDSSFQPITITTSLLRKKGKVSLACEGKVWVADPNGVRHGDFLNYQDQSDSSGKFTNTFTMGNDQYEGPLYVIATTQDSTSGTLSDTTIIYSQK